MHYPNILIEMLSEEKRIYDQGFDILQSEFSWSKVVEPLRRYAQYGSNAPDRDQFLRSMHMDPTLHQEVIQGTVKRAAYLWATKGTQALFDQTIYHIKFLINKR